MAKRYNVEMVFRPFIKVEAVSAKEFRAQRTNILDYTSVVFTSRHAVDHFFHLAQELRVNIPEDMKYFCITETVALYIQKYVQYRKRKVFFGSTGKMDALLPAMMKRKTDKYLIPQSDVHTDEIAQMFESHHLIHKEVIMYRTVSNDFAADESFDYDMLLFFSPAGVTALLKNFPDFKQGDIAIGCFGPTTAKAIQDAGLRLDLQAPTATAPSMTAALDEFIKTHKD